MLLQVLRRWLARHSATGVLGVALGLALLLGGAQVAAARHEIAHASAPADGKALHANGHECPTCLLAAALGGAATAPPAVLPPAADDAPTAFPDRAHDFTPRQARAYASRAPPPADTVAA